MARLSDRKTLSNEEIEASVEELSRKLEILRVRYEQYFIGVEKVAPSVMRMEVVRIMRDLEQLKIKNTAIKFKLRTVVQKFTSYSTYWNRTLREIEDGTYKRHVDKAKREAVGFEAKCGANVKRQSIEPNASQRRRQRSRRFPRFVGIRSNAQSAKCSDEFAECAKSSASSRIEFNAIAEWRADSRTTSGGATSVAPPSPGYRRGPNIGAPNPDATNGHRRPTAHASAAQARHVATACAACAVQAHHVAATFAACHADAFASHSRRATTTNPVVASACGSTFDASTPCRAVRGAQSCTIFTAHACGASAATAAFAASDAPTASDRPPIVAARSAQSHARSHGLAIDASPRATDQR